MTVLTGAMPIGGSEVRGGKGEIRALADDNPLGPWRRVDGRLER